jgi:hypothetical protein
MFKGIFNGILLLILMWKKVDKQAKGLLIAHFES